ncbi:DUF1254 domain-containing protein [Rhodococcus sp. NPDC003322]
MQRRAAGRVAATLSVGLLGALLVGCGAADPVDQEAHERAETAADGFVYGYAPVALARTRANMTCLLPVNQLHNQSRMSGPDSRTVVAPNVDTLYSIAWLDLRAGPVLLSHPEMGERYFGFQFLDIYSNVFANVGTREIGSAPGAHLIVPPGWSGTAPDSARVIESPTWDAWMIGRTLVESESDLPAAQDSQKRYAMRVAGPAPATAPPSLPPTDCGNNPAPQAMAGSGAAFFDELAAILAANPPPAADAPLLEGISTLGVEPGSTPSAGDPEDVAALATGVVLGGQRIDAAVAVGADTSAGAWSTLADAGRYGTDYLHRAVVARIGLGANVPEESIYHVTRTSADGQPLRGHTGHRLHFAAADLPPVDPRGFWSITLYGPDMFLVPNDMGRYAIGDRTPGLVRGADGSLDVWVSASPPPSGTANWLPAPDGEFVLMLRTYLPAEPSWTPPPAQPE